MSPTTGHEAEVGARFDLLHARFKREVGPEDVRLRALRACLGPLPGLRALDLGCGKGRFASRLAEEGARVVGVDLSAAMLGEAKGLDRVRASARRLPFADQAFDAVVAVEVFEHLAAIDDVLGEAHRVLRPGGLLAVVDKNAGSWNAQRPWLPNLAVKWIDEKRGRWMYPSGGPVRERWFWPGAFRARLSRTFEDVRVEHLLSPHEDGRGLFSIVPGARLLTLWTARAGRRPLVTNFRATHLPALPLLLWDTPPGLEVALAQEGVAYRVVRDPHPLAFRGGRFVLFDSRRLPAATVRGRLSHDHVAIDIDRCRRGEPVDPFAAMVDTRAGYARWEVDGYALTERVSRRPKAMIRARVVERMRHAVEEGGGLWARLSAFPFPYRSAFNFRADLDETLVDDYERFARARRPIDDCCTHFVSTHAYGGEPAVLHDLQRFDTQSHGHYHVVYRDPAANRRNLWRAHRALGEAGIEPVGFAAPHGRWNPGLDAVLEELGYVYSSDFQLGYDDLPFFPWREKEGRFSTVLQVPIHPVCEGLFFEAGADGGRVVAEHMVRAVRAKIGAGEPAFVYGHPERRLGRHPEVLAALVEAIAGEALLWRTTLTDFARWWRWRSERLWSVVARGEGGYEVQFEDWDPAYPVALEVVRGRHVSSLPIEGPRAPLRLEGLAYESREVRIDLPAPRVVAGPPGLKSAFRKAIDWETVTPIDELPAGSFTDRVKKRLRWWQTNRREGAET